MKDNKYSDLEDNEGLPLVRRVEHLEREARFVREYATNNETFKIIVIALGIVAITLSFVSLFK